VLQEIAAAVAFVRGAQQKNRIVGRMRLKRIFSD